MADANHWNERYDTIGSTQVSWFETDPVVSLELFDLIGVSPEDPVIDIGGGASVLVDALIARGHRDVTVLDVADRALAVARARIGATTAVEWVAADLLDWRPDRRRRVWHDRAVMHFLVEDTDLDRYVDRLQAAVEPDGFVVVGVFAEDGPETCSALPVRRWSIADLTAFLADEVGVDVIESRRHVHHTPAGHPQPFTWVAGRRTGSRASL